MAGDQVASSKRGSRITPSVAHNALNYFEPYEQYPPRHENQLTRALAVLLRLSPMAQTAWLRRVDRELALWELPPVEMRVQKRELVPQADKLAEPEQLRVISVFLSGEREEASGAIEPSERHQVLDAVFLYGQVLAVVVENKLAGEPDDWQARQLNLGGLTLAVDERPRALRWRDLLSDFAEILSKGLVTGAEAGVLEDFLEYVEAYFGELLPFNNLALCHGALYRQQRRCRMVLTEATGIEARQDREPSVPLPGATSVARAYLRMTEEGDVELCLYPADTLSQAREFYGRPQAVPRLRDLRDRGWEIETNFHFGYMAQGLVWTWGDLSVDRYLDLWSREIDETGQVKRQDWDEYWDWLVSEGIASAEHHESFERDFIDTQRQEATPRPGLRIYRIWPLVEAEQLDEGRRFVDAVSAALAEALEALDETPPEP